MSTEAFWRQVQRKISEATGQDFVLQSHRQVSGGDINEAFRIDGLQQTFFIKLNTVSRWEMFAAEAQGLRTIGATRTIRVPLVVDYGTLDDKSYLLLEYLTFGKPGNQAELAKQLAAMHRVTQSRFGFEENNFIGSSEQHNPPSDNWCEFFAQHRIGFQLKLLAQKGISKRMQEKGSRLIDELDKFFTHYTPCPALIHGDLWQGNYDFMADGSPVIYDPACYFADHEAELAMMELFSQLDTRFLESYHQIFPIDTGYPMRKDLYNLYHLLNHANLFGGFYVAQSEAMIERLLSI